MVLLSEGSLRLGWGLKHSEWRYVGRYESFGLDIKGFVWLLCIVSIREMCINAYVCSYISDGSALS